MAFGDSFKKLNLSGIGAKLRALGQKLSFKKKSLPESPSSTDHTDPGFLDDAPNASSMIENTDPMLELPKPTLGARIKRALKLSSKPASNGEALDTATSNILDDGAPQQPSGNALQRLSGKTLAFAGRLTSTLKENFPKNLEDLKKIQPEELMDRMRELTGGGATGMYLRLGAAAFAAYFLADTVSLFTDSLIPDAPPVPAPIVKRTEEKQRSINEYAAVVDSNMFIGHTIPSETVDPNGPARKTNLPLVLIGTVVLKNELKSIATIEDRSANMVFPVRIDDVMNNQIQIKKIEHLRVTFLNMNSNQMEFVEIIEDTPVLRIESARPTAPKGEGGVTKLDDTHVQIEQKVIRDGMANLNEVLQQARAIPNFENGMPDGYKILQIAPGSIFEKLGIKNGDVISGLNGEPVNDPGKALGLLNDLPNANHVEITVKRNGHKQTMNFDIR